MFYLSLHGVTVMQEGETGMSTLRSLSKSVRMWVIAKTDDKGGRTYLSNFTDEWHVNLMFADIVEYDVAVRWLDRVAHETNLQDRFDGIALQDVRLLPVTVTVEEN